MDYQQHYNVLIERGKNRQCPEDLYVEIHHVIPVCLDGKNNSENLVALTPEEHYVAHQLLVKIYPGNYKLVHAAHMMTVDSHGTRINNKLYGWIKRKLAIIVSERFSGGQFHGPHKIVTCPHCGESGGKNGMKRYHFENCINHCDASKQEENKKHRGKGSGKPQSTATKEKRRITQKDNHPRIGTKHTEETRRRMREIKLNAPPHPIVECPHCGTKGGGGNMTRHHFKNCKLNEANKTKNQ